jgi:signal transduction histidine kinase
MPSVLIERMLDRRPGWPRPTARLRLTFFYGSLFLVAGAGLLTITYLLVRSAPIGKIGIPALASKSFSKPPPSGQASKFVRNAQALATHAIDLHQLITGSGIALAIMVVLAVALGWLVAGRVLRPLRTINTAAQRISASNLHERLALSGPDDEFKELGGTLNDLLGRLEASFQSQENFVANASHELRTPLTLECSLLETALADPDTTAESWRATGQRLLATNRQQAQLIDALLTLARSQRGLEEQDRLDLALIAEDVLDTRDRQIASCGLFVEADLSSAPMVGDPDLVESLVVNLVDNALRHNVAGGRIEIATDARSGAVVISVGNTGPIIPQDETTRLLQPFQRLSGRTRTAEGHGVGLAIVQAIATAHGADLTLRPRGTGGLDVEVRFPPLTDLARANPTGGPCVGRKIPAH